MAFGIESFKKMEIPVPNDEEVLLVPRTLYWINSRKGGWTDAILVLTDKGIHFRVRKDKIGYYPSLFDDAHSLLENTFLAYNRIKSYQRGSLLWANTYAIEMVDGCVLRFAFHKDMAKVTEILNHLVQPDMPRDLTPYDYSSHAPESVPHKMVPVGR